MNANLQEAMKSANAKQKPVLAKLIRYFQTGNPKDWEAYNIAWLKADPVVDGNLGFIETYVDARGQKGQWEALINYRNAEENQMMELIARKAQYFEDRMPWPEAYKRKKVTLPVAKAIDSRRHQPPAPRRHQPAQRAAPPREVRQQEHPRGQRDGRGLGAAAAAAGLRVLPHARGSRPGPAVLRHRARKWLVAFHEVLGHASGQVDKKKLGKQLPSASTSRSTTTRWRRRARTWWRCGTRSIRRSPSCPRTPRRSPSRCTGTSWWRGSPTWRRVEKGDAFEEDHQRGHHMTVNFLVEKGRGEAGDGQRATRTGGADYAKMRAAGGRAAHEAMVIKATGDYEGIRALVTAEGHQFDPKLRDEVVQRVKAADVPAVLFIAAPRLVPVVDDKGQVTDLKVDIQHVQALSNATTLLFLANRTPCANSTPRKTGTSAQ